MEVSRIDWFFNGFCSAVMLALIIILTFYFFDKAHYKQYDEEVVYRVKDAWREDGSNVYMSRVNEMNAKAKQVMETFTNMGYRVSHIGNTAFGGIPFKEVTFTKK